MSLPILLPVLIGLVLVIIGVIGKDPTVRDIGIGFLGGGTTTGVAAGAATRRVP